MDSTELLTPTLDWEIEVLPVTVDEEEVEDFQAILNGTTREVLNIPKASYEPITNAYLKEIVEKLSELTLNPIQGYQSLDGGKKVLAFLKTEGVEVGGFPTNSYMVIGNSHDYSTGFFIGTSLVVIRCMNSFSMLSQKMKVSHTKTYDTRVEELMTYFETHVTLQEQLTSHFNELHKVSITQDTVMKAIYHVLGVEFDDVVTSRRQKTIDEIQSCIDRECKDFGLNLLGLFNGFTYYTTHIKKYKSPSFGTIFGTGAEMNQKALRFCQKYLDGLIDG